MPQHQGEEQRHREHGDPGAADELVDRTTTSTAPVIVRPRALITRDRCIRRRSPGSVSVRSSRFQCRTMPVWLVVNDTKTPTM